MTSIQSQTILDRGFNLNGVKIKINICLFYTSLPDVRPNTYSKSSGIASGGENDFSIGSWLERSRAVAIR